jgi:putative transcriptional regulator
MAFAAGQRSDALGLLTACHLESCATCRGRAALFERVGGELLDDLPPSEVSHQLLESVMQRLDDPQGEADHPEPVIETRLPAPLRRILPGGLEKTPWKGWVRDIQEYPLPVSDETYTAKFYRIASGTALPEHTHEASEYTLVLEGSFSDGMGDYHPGDFIVANERTVHRPVAHRQRDCICFAVMDGAIRMTGRWTRLLNPLLR